MNAFSGIETPQFRHLFLCQRKIENSEILFHSVCVSRFRKNDKSVLSFKSKNDGSVLLTLSIWKDVHPALVTIPVDWEFRIPRGLMHAEHPGEAAAAFLKAVQKALKAP